MELTITLSRTEYEKVTAALVNAELDAWDRSRKSKDEQGRKIGVRDELACQMLRNRIEAAFDSVAPWTEERRCY